MVVVYVIDYIDNIYSTHILSMDKWLSSMYYYILYLFSTSDLQPSTAIANQLPGH